MTTKSNLSNILTGDPITSIKDDCPGSCPNSKAYRKSNNILTSLPIIWSNNCTSCREYWPQQFLRVPPAPKESWRTELLKHWNQILPIYQNHQPAQKNKPSLGIKTIISKTINVVIKPKLKAFKSEITYYASIVSR